MNKVIDKGFRSCRFVSTIVKHPVYPDALVSMSMFYISDTFLVQKVIFFSVAIF